MEARLFRSLVIQGTGLTILLALIVRFIWSILCDARWAWQRRQQVFPAVSHPADLKGEILVVEVVVSKLDQKLVPNSSEVHQLPTKANHVHLSTAQVALPLPSSRVLPEEADHIQGRTPLKTFYKVYSGVSPRTRLL